jgi:hypothetical protein
MLCITLHLSSEESSQDATVRTALQSQGVTVTYLQPAAQISSDTAAAATAAAVVADSSEKGSVSLSVARHLYSLGLLAAIWDVGAALRASALQAGCIQSACVRCVQSSSSNAVQQQQSTAVLDTNKWLQEGGADMIRAAIKGADVVDTDSAVCLDDGTVVIEALVVPNSRPLQA